MSIAQWRQFNFFDKQQAFDPVEKNKTPSLFQKQDISVFAAGRGHVAVSDSTGNVYIADRSFKTQMFTAYDGGRVTHLKQMKQKNILVTIGEEDLVSGIPVVKFWDLDALKPIEGSDDIILPTLLRTIKIQHGGKTYPVSTLAVLENLSQAAIGLANGVVILIRGDLSKDKTVKQKVIYEGEEPITGLGFREQTKSTILFIVTTSNIMSYNTTAVKPSVTILDEQGCGLGCAIMNDQQEMIVGRDEAIYLYDPTGRGPCFAYDTPKSSLTWFKSSYLVIISPPVMTSTTSNLSSAARSSFNSKRISSSTSELTKIAIFDTANKFLAYTGTFLGGVRGVFCEWNSVWVIGMDGKLYHLDEKDTPTKLEILFKLNLYVLAINLAHMQKYDDTSIAEIFKKYGDHLYSKGDYDGAMEQYIRTIGQLEPSYVIRKFLDAQRIYNLTNYLQELHSKGLANADHTTLLLNCYTKLKDVSRLDQFIKADTDLNFDLETAISVCRQAGYFEHAVYLAEKFQEHDLYLDIVIEDMKNYDTAVTYIRKLGPYEADRNLHKYSKTLLSHLPDQTTQLLIELCSGTLPPVGVMSPTPSMSNTKALSNLPFSGGDSSSSIFSDNSGQMMAPTSVSLGKLVQTKNLKLGYTPPSPRKFMPAFVDRPDCLCTFLEQVFEKLWNLESVWSPQEQEERKAIWNTLLELYLMDPTGDELTDRQKQKRQRAFRQKALTLLQDDSVHYDTNQALVLCQLKEFDEGIVYLYEKTGMYTDILRYWMEKGQTDRVIEGVRKYGPKDASLYPMVLSYFSSTPEVMTKSTSELLSVLKHIDEKDLLPPIQVVQALSRSNVATIGLLKGYIGKKIQHEHEELKQNEELIESYREETDKRRKEIEELQTSARIFQVQKCSACEGTLDLPAVHFLCRHSYHQRCLGDNDRECPQCAIQHRMITEIRRAQEANADRHDLFFDQLDNDEDGFAIIADYFSKNTMAFAKLID
ncbi:vacuolar protein sorting-associated protein 11 [Backusella circina FSU 941]|nr:vacuolar protein sorting-associated protein 11 [Backusella circina FSU 941]